MGKQDSRTKEYNKNEFKIVSESKDLMLVKCDDNKYRFLNKKNVEKRNFTFSINDYDRADKEFMEFILNQEDFNKSIHYLILNWIKKNGSKNIKIDRFGNLVDV